MPRQPPAKHTIAGKNCVKRILYLGLEPPLPAQGEHIVHLPVIEIVPRPFAHPAITGFYTELGSYTHAIFTSKSAVEIFFSYLPHFGYGPKDLSKLTFAAVGKATAARLQQRGAERIMVAKMETAEGLCEELQPHISASDYFCWPHSALSREVVVQFLQAHGCRYKASIFYDTHFVRPPAVPALDDIDEIVFTSPSTIEGFRLLYNQIPWHKKLTTLGPVTEKRLFLLQD